MKRLHHIAWIAFTLFTVLAGGVLQAGPKEKKADTILDPMGGICPVTLVDTREVEKGKSSVTSVYDNRQYQFKSKKEKEAFDAEPEKYIPAFGGHCVVTWAKDGKEVSGDPKLSILYEGQLFLFADDAAKQAFSDAPNEFAPVAAGDSGKCAVCMYHNWKYFKNEASKEQMISADKSLYRTFDGLRYYSKQKYQQDEFFRTPFKYLPAGGGFCLVTLKRDGKRVRGSSDFMLFHEDRVYLFAGADELDAFKADPDTYKNTDLAFHGKCPIAAASKKEADGSWSFAQLYRGKFYLCADAKALETFQSAPEKYLESVEEKSK